MTSIPPDGTLEFRRIDAARRRARRYRLVDSRTLFGALALLITWGRIGAQPRIRVETFGDEVARSARRTELLARRSAHGCRSHVDENAE
jgi:predicted DNA-binding WGR domain protein